LIAMKRPWVFSPRRRTVPENVEVSTRRGALLPFGLQEEVLAPEGQAAVDLFADESERPAWLEVDCASKMS
jgi:hypothetical protein